MILTNKEYKIQPTKFYKEKMKGRTRWIPKTTRLIPTDYQEEEWSLLTVLFKRRMKDSDIHTRKESPQDTEVLQGERRGDESSKKFQMYLERLKGPINREIQRPYNSIFGKVVWVVTGGQVAF